VIKVKSGNKVYRYLRIIESLRRRGKVTKRVIANIGELSLINKESLFRLGKSLLEYAGRKPVSVEDLEAISALHYGEVITTKSIWDSLSLNRILKDSLPLKKKINFDYSFCVFIMVLNRLISPKSKLAITKWQDRIYTEKTKPKYQYYLRTLNYLAKSKEKIEKSLFFQLTDLFSLKLNLIFYDLTSCYFEGSCCPLAKFGYSRDRRPDKKQIILGLLVTDEGLPIAHRVYNGNISDKSTLKETIDTLKEQFQIKQCIFVGDRGLVSEENLEYLIKTEYPFIVTLRKRNLKEVESLLKTAPSHYTIVSDTFHLKEVKVGNMRYLICKNPVKTEDDESFRNNLIEEISSRLKGLSKSPQDNLKKASEILVLKKAKRYFIIGIDERNNFFFKLNEKVIDYEKELDGAYILKTNVLDLEASKIVEAYKNLSEVEDAFREIKDFLRLRPIYHYSPLRVKGHVMVCFLSYLIEKILEKHLKRANVGLSPREALEYLNTLRIVENRIAGQNLFCVTTPSKEHRQILKSVGITNLPRILKT